VPSGVRDQAERTARRAARCARPDRARL